MSIPMRVVLAVLVVTFAGGVGWSVLLLQAAAPGLTEEVNQRMGESGVTNPVTAVLLNFRGYDTFLEVGVLTAVAAAVWALAPWKIPSAAAPYEPILPALVRQLGPVIILAAGFLLWQGSHAPGGAFQAGALLGGLGVLGVLARSGMGFLRHPLGMRLGLVTGGTVFLLVGVATVAGGRPLLTYPPAWAGHLILLIETAVMTSVGLILVTLFLGGRPENAPAPKSGP